MLVLIIIIVVILILLFLKVCIYTEYFIASPYNKFIGINKIYPYHYYLPQSMITTSGKRQFKHHNNDHLIYPLY